MNFDYFLARLNMIIIMDEIPAAASAVKGDTGE